MSPNSLFLGASVALALTGSALAQTTPAPVTHGPVPAGICIISTERAVALSAVGKAFSARFQSIGQTVQAELRAEETAVTNEAKAIDAGRATMDQNSFDKRVADLTVRRNALQRKVQLRSRELEATQAKQMERISRELDPAAKAAYSQRGCGLLLSAEAVQLGNPSADITDQVVQLLNARIQTITFDRERLDQPAAVAPAAAPRPAGR